tara:strand:- start:221 stop:361 length:141 start_codon:yes stop_codon:yes gene_type:complete
MFDFLAIISEMDRLPILPNLPITDRPVNGRKAPKRRKWPLTEARGR